MKIPTILFVVAAAAQSLLAGGLEQASVTRIYNTVDLLPPDSGARPAAVGDPVAGRTAVQTGNQSRAELTFTDQTLARLGGNSVFSFERGTRDINLDKGVILLQVPKNAGGATINTAAVTAAVTGTTVMVEADVDADGNGIMKFIVLEGEMRLSLNGRLGESLLLGPGQMIAVPADALSLPGPVVVDLARLMETSGLMSDQFTPFPNEPLILEAAREQQVLKSDGQLVTVDYALKGNEMSPILQTVSDANQAQFRTNTIQPVQPEPVRASAPRPPAPPPSNNPRPPAPKPPEPPRPPKPDPRPPKPPPAPKPQPPQPPPVPPPVPPAPSTPPNSQVTPES
jgi:hypothetical protein